MEVIHELSDMACHSPKLSVQSAAADVSTEPQYGTSPRRWPASHLVKKGQYSVLTRTHTQDVGLPSLNTTLLPNPLVGVRMQRKYDGLLAFPCSPPPWSSWWDGAVGWPPNDSGAMSQPPRWYCLTGLGKVLQMAVEALHLHSLHGGVSPRPGVTRNRGGETRIRPSVSPPSDPLTKFLLPGPVTLCSASLQAVVSKWRMLPPKDTTMIQPPDT